MRWFVVLASLVVAGIASGGSGRVIAIDAPREVIVPAGQFVMGIDSDAVSTMKDQCRLAFEQNQMRQIPLPGGTGAMTFCEMYEKELDAMVDSITDDDGGHRDRRVYLSAYAIDRTEVSVADYRRCIAAGSCGLEPLIAGDERYIMDEYPIVNVTWDEAQTYCRWHGGRLPTEAEWERAARGEDHREWPWGDRQRDGDFNHGKERVQAMREIDRVAWVGVPVQFLGDPDDSDGSTLLAKPGSYPWGESPYGTRDQAGNVAEWTADAFGGISPSLMLNERTFGYSELSSINPRRDGAPGDPKVVRGGSWRQPRWLARANLRDPFNMLYVPDARFSHIGFRCARSLD